MSQRIMFRQLARANFPLQRTMLPAAIRYTRMQSALSYSTQLPSVTQASFWESLIPKPLRRHGRTKVKKAKSKEWNPATFFIIIMLLIGSMSIQMIALKNDFAAFSRRADAKIDLLREVIEKIQNGEEVDVEGLLGTGNAEQEKEWEEVLREIEKEDELWTAARKKKPVKRTPLKEEPAPAPEKVDSTKPKATSTAPAGFY